VAHRGLGDDRCPGDEGVALMLAVLRQRNFALVWAAGLISLTGD